MYLSLLATVQLLCYQTYMKGKVGVSHGYCGMPCNGGSPSSE